MLFRSEADPGIDGQNPDHAKRGRPVAGIPILLGMKPAGENRWNGRIYNAENGKFYSGGVSMLKDGRLRIRGCILGFLCGGENWTRVANAPMSESNSVLCSRVSS